MMKKLLQFLLILGLGPLCAKTTELSGLIRSYQFNNNVLDSSSYIQHLSTTPTFTWGRFCDANGAAAFITNTSGLAMPFASGTVATLANNTYTYSVWVRFLSVPTSNSFILTVGSSGGDQTIYATPTGFNAHSYHNTSSVLSITGAKTKVEINNWYHLVSVKRADSLLLFVNGSLEGKKVLPANNTSNYGSAPAAYIASRSGEPSLRGIVDAVKIYNRGLSNEEVIGLYNTDKATICGYTHLGLIRDYRFSGNLMDSSIASSHITKTVTYDKGRFCDNEGALVLNGTGTGVSVPLTSANGLGLLNTSYTYSAWVKINVRPRGTSAACILAVGNEGGDQTLGITKTKFLGGSYYTVNGSVANMNDSSTTVPEVGKWYHVVSVRRQDSMLLYVNGVLEGRKALPLGNTVYYSTGPDAQIGERAAGGMEIFNGSIDDVKIYNKGLSRAEVLALYQNNQGRIICTKPDPIGLVRSYEFTNNTLDSSTLKMDITSAPSFVRGRYCENNSAVFVGSESLMFPFVANNNSSLDLEQYTYSAWVKLSARAGNNNALGIVGIGGTGGDQSIVAVYNGFAAISYMVNASKSIALTAVGTTLPELGKWYHVVSVKRQDSLLLYVNGQLEGKVKCPVGYYTDYGTAAKGRVGTRPSTMLPLNGSVDAVKVFDKVLSVTEIKALYADTKGRSLCTNVQENALVRSYQFTGNNIDSSGFYANTSAVAKYSRDRFCKLDKALLIHRGYNAQVTIPFISANHFSLDLDAYSYVAWVKLLEKPIVTADTQRVLTVGLHGISVTNSSFVINASVQNTNTRTLQKINAVGAVNPEVGKWYQVVSVKTADSLILYINGTLASKSALPVPNISNYGDYNATLGSLSTAYNFIGALDDVKIYNYAISKSAVKDLYALGGSLCVQPKDSLLRDYRFSNNLADSSVYKADVINTPSGVVYEVDQVCKSNGAIKVNSSAISMKMDAELMSNNYTYVTWVKPNSLVSQGNSRGIIGIGGYSGDQTLLQVNNGFRTTSYVSFGVTVTANSLTMPTVGTWYHLACVRKADSLYLYVNGVLEGMAKSSTAGAIYGNTPEAGIGWRPAGGIDAFDGAISDVKIYNVALSKGNIAKLYNASKPAPDCVVGVEDRELADENLVQVYVDENGEIRIKSELQVKNVMLSNTLGQMQNFGAVDVVKTQQKGFLILVVETDKGTTSRKIVK